MSFHLCRLAMVAALVAASGQPSPAAAETAAPLQAVMQDVDGDQIMAFFTSEAGRCSMVAMPSDDVGRRMRAVLAPSADLVIEGVSGAMLRLTCGAEAGFMSVERRMATAKLASR